MQVMERFLSDHFGLFPSKNLPLAKTIHTPNVTFTVRNVMKQFLVPKHILALLHSLSEHYIRYYNAPYLAQVVTFFFFLFSLAQVPASSFSSSSNKMVIVIGAGPAGIATSACLNNHSIPNIVLEREDCAAPTWKKRTYDRLHLHIPKEVCQLPHMPFPKDYPKYVPRKLFIQYLDDYMTHFKVNPMYNRMVESTTYNQVTKQWCVKVKNTATGEYEEYSDRFLVVAPGPLNEPYTPMLRGIDKFPGHVMHSTEYKNGEAYANKNVLVIGSGNSGMEIAFDLSNNGAKASIVIRSPVHVLSKTTVYMALVMEKILPESFVDWLMVKIARLEYGDLTKYGIHKPKEGPSYLINTYGKFPIIDMGALSKIKNGEIQTLPSITNINGNVVECENGKSYPFDALVFATGFKRSTKTWLKDDDHLDEEGLPKQKFPNHWKGKKGFYCAGLEKKGLYGIRLDAVNIANDIKKLL